MSQLTDILNKLVSLTRKVNDITDKSKKIDDLPIQSNLDISSKIHVSRSGNSESLTIAKIIESIKSESFDQLLSIGKITQVANVLTIPAGAQAKISDVIYITTAAIEIPIPPTEIGYIRKDILVFNTSNQIVLEMGDESQTVAFRPNIPEGTVLVTELNVNDSGVEVNDPILGNSFVAKSERTPTILSNSGNIINLDTESGFFVFNGSYSQIDSINAENFNYTGKTFSFKNEQTTDVVLLYNPGSPTTNQLLFRFPNLESFVLKPNHQIDFRSRGNGRLDFIGSINQPYYEEFIYTSGAQTFNLPIGTKVLSVHLNNAFLKKNLWPLSNNILTINEPLNEFDEIIVTGIN